ncbi:transcription factor IIF subunit tfg1 [Coniosporium tulheliwenetii]|uniref:Transcription factor IIF subunit tfg1 n=1 Tax=Coniosporium tulheliwenetii TaxID=3383036 RepID=A0ACC2ZQQ2_9PEZI|nr:transcription factor IIF subunit tfg1 [Cladosporium sp. JES 115]
MSASPAPPPGSTPNGAPSNAIPPRRPKANPLVAARRPPARRPPPPAGSANGVPGTASSKHTFQQRVRARRSTARTIDLTQQRTKSEDGSEDSSAPGFVRPISLHRRRLDDDSGLQKDGDQKEGDEDDKQREQQQALKDERMRKRQENQAKIAPSAKNNRAARSGAFQKKTEQLFRTNDTPEAIKRQQLRYEEALPWHLEDDSGQRLYVGTYEAALSGCHVLLLPEETGQFRMLPLEKWYNFTAKQRVEKQPPPPSGAGAKKEEPAQWGILGTIARHRAKQAADEEERKTLGPRIKRPGEQDDAKPTSFFTGKRDVEDADIIDFELGEEFQDDEERDLFGADDEENIKETEEKLKKEQLKANVFELGNEQRAWQEEEEQKKAEELKKKLERDTRKALVKREKDYNYESDENFTDEANDPQSDSEDEAKRKEEEEKRREEERKALAENKDKDKTKSDKPPSGASTKGTNTPTGRPKQPEQPAKLASLKRPGSPNLSDASGNESTQRKKAKKNNHDANPALPSRPDVGSRKPSIAMRVAAGSGSDTEATATDGGKKPRLKIRMSPNGTPNGSRAGSPAAGGRPNGSRAGSPSAIAPLPSVAEIQAKIPPEGISMKDIIASFRERSKGRPMEFVQLLKQNARFDNKTKMFFPKPS